MSLRDFLGRYKTRLARSPAKTGAVVRGVYYAPGKMMPDVIQASAEPTAGESVLSRIRKRFKKNKHNATLTGVTDARNAAAGAGNYGNASGAVGSGGGAGGSGAGAAG